MTAIRNYLPLFKLRICGLITFSALIGLVAASRGIDYRNAAFLIVATMLASAAASAFNHYFDRDIDTVMKRTAKRPLPSATVAGSKTVLAASCALLALSILVSLGALNWMVALHLGAGAFVYAIVYTVWLKRRSWTNTIIGGLAGSFAVLAGGASASPELCAPPVLLAVVMFFWTPSHFWSFAILHRKDYERAGVPVLPVVVGERRTALYTLLNTLILAGSSILPYALGRSGEVYLGAALLTGAWFILLNVRLLRRTTPETARGVFRGSMAYLAVLFIAFAIDSALQL